MVWYDKRPMVEDGSLVASLVFGGGSEPASRLDARYALVRVPAWTRSTGTNIATSRDFY